MPPDFATLTPVEDDSTPAPKIPDFGSLEPDTPKVPDFKTLQPETPELDLSQPKIPTDSMERAARDFQQQSSSTAKMPTSVTINPDDFETKLSSADEAKFQKWKQQYAPNDDGHDYDFRGAFKAGLTPSVNGHWPDTFKKPNEPTFSDESIYAQQLPQLAGTWKGEQFTPPPNKPFVSTPQQIQQEQKYEEIAKNTPTEGLITSVPRATVADIAAGFAAKPEYSGNIPAAVMGKPLPIDDVIQSITKSDPKAATFAKASQNIAAQAPQFLLPFGALPKLAQRAVAGAFTYLMLKNAKPVAQALGDEYGKPADQRDPDKIRDLWADALTTSGFAAAGGYGALRSGAAAESPALAKLFTKTIVEAYSPQEMKAMFRRVTTGNATPEENNLYRTIAQAVTSPGQAVRKGATVTTSMPRFDYTMLSKYLGLPDRYFSVKITGEPTAQPTTEQGGNYGSLRQLSPGEVVQREPETTGKEGDLSGRVEPGEQGEEAAPIQPAVPVEEQAATGPVNAGEVAPQTPITADTVLQRPKGTTSPQEISTLTEPDWMKLTEARSPDGQRMFKMGEDATRWALNNPQADVTQLEQMRDERAKSKNLVMRQTAQWFGDAVHVLKGDDIGKQNARDFAAQAPQPESVTPAITYKKRVYRLAEGEENHDDIIARVRAELGIPKSKRLVGVKRGFILPDGTFSPDREKAAKIAQVPTTVEPGKLHSEDLVNAKEPWQMTQKEWSAKMKSEYGRQGFPDLAAKKWHDARHREYVEQAFKEGKPVPPEVLADYPDLKPSPSVVKPEGAHDVYSIKSPGGSQDVRIAVDKSGNIVSGAGTIGYAAKDGGSLYGEDFVGKNLKDVQKDFPSFKKQSYQVDPNTWQVVKPEEPLKPSDIGYRSDKAFQRDYAKNGLKEHGETETEFMMRRHCGGGVPKAKTKALE